MTTRHRGAFCQVASLSAADLAKVLLALSTCLLIAVVRRAAAMLRAPAARQTPAATVAGGPAAEEDGQAMPPAVRADGIADGLKALAPAQHDPGAEEWAVAAGPGAAANGVAGPLPEAGAGAGAVAQEALRRRRCMADD